ncbi:hypothetical protein J4E93_006945 [Alternaria ventricosa]|uniref:uncharacterized protein n=1 Tax=Alternaria ventricosa TaxID=1187951 RepID=UPI0020C2B542|nr:uncharacterized protein J4E93_006945 [Alternaria ventricosa]KAI4642876.1 hypothetical protein J4E93_006945 [Alternaria ventricosa]
MSDAPQDTLPETFEIPSNKIIYNQIRASMKILGEQPEPQGLNFTVRARVEAEIETERKLVVEARKRLERAEERWHLEQDRSIYANAEKGRKISGLCALMDKIKEVMPEDAWADVGEASEEHDDSSDSS